MSPPDEVPWLKELWPQLCQLIKDTVYHKVTFEHTKKEESSGFCNDRISWTRAWALK